MFKELLNIEFATFCKNYFTDEEGNIFSLSEDKNLIGEEFTTVILKDTHSNFFYALPTPPAPFESDTITGELEDYGTKITKEQMALEVASSLIIGESFEPSQYYIDSALEILSEKGVHVSGEKIQEILNERLNNSLSEIYEARTRYSAYSFFEYRKNQEIPDEVTAIEKIFNKEYLYNHAKELLTQNPYLLIPFTTQVPKNAEQIDVIEQLPESIRVNKEALVMLVSMQPSVLFTSQMDTLEKIELVTHKEILKDELFLGKLEKLIDSPKNKHGFIESLIEVVAEESRKTQHKKNSINIAV